MRLNQFTKAAILWLETLLFERYGHRFSLEQNGETIRIHLSGSERYIIFPQCVPEFRSFDSQFGCMVWSAEAESFSSPLGLPIPTPSPTPLAKPIMEDQGDHYVVNYDIPGLTYWMLSRVEEVNAKDLDNHSRFPAKASHAFKHSYLERPIVDEWLDILRQVIHRVWPALELKTHRFSVRVSHDVDCPSKYAFTDVAGFLRVLAGDIIKRRDFRSALTAPLIKFASRTSLHRADPMNTFEWIMDVSDAHGLKSAFYFICGRTDKHFDADYNITDPALRSLIRRIYERGHEIGLHPSYKTYLNSQLLAQEAKALWSVCDQEAVYQEKWGGRMHFLRWSHPYTLRAWADAGMDYDSTFSYADLPGFRCGTCHEYPAFDPVDQIQLGLRIRPLVAMECTVIAKRYANLGTGNVALRKFSALKDACRAVQGTFTLLWHNSLFSTEGERDLYCKILES